MVDGGKSVLFMEYYAKAKRVFTLIAATTLAMTSKYLLLYLEQFQKHWKRMMLLAITILPTGEDRVAIGAGNIT